MTNWPEASAVASATVLPASRSSTLAFGAARPAMTASPVGSTFTTSKAGLSGETVGSLAASTPRAPRARGGLDGGRRREERSGVFGSGALARPAARRGFGQKNPGWVQQQRARHRAYGRNRRRRNSSDPNQRILRQHARSLSPRLIPRKRSWLQMTVTLPS